MKQNVKEDQPMWQECDCCGDYFCVYCDDHAADCDCPTIDVFAIYGKSPYFDSYLFKQGELMPDPDGYDDGMGGHWDCPDHYILRDG